MRNKPATKKDPVSEKTGPLSKIILQSFFQRRYGKFRPAIGWQIVVPVTVDRLQIALQKPIAVAVQQLGDNRHAVKSLPQDLPRPGTAQRLSLIHI